MAKTKATQQIVSPEVINMIRDIDRSLFDKREELHLDLFHMSLLHRRHVTNKSSISRMV